MTARWLMDDIPLSYGTLFGSYNRYMNQQLYETFAWSFISIIGRVTNLAYMAEGLRLAELRMGTFAQQSSMTSLEARCYVNCMDKCLIPDTSHINL